MLLKHVVFLNNIDPSRTHARAQTYTCVLPSCFSFGNLLISETRGALLTHPVSHPPTSLPHPPTPLPPVTVAAVPPQWPLLCGCPPTPPLPPSSRPGPCSHRPPAFNIFSSPSTPPILPSSLSPSLPPSLLPRHSLQWRSAARVLSAPLDGATRSTAGDFGRRAIVRACEVDVCVAAPAGRALCVRRWLFEKSCRLSSRSRGFLSLSWSAVSRVRGGTGDQRAAHLDSQIYHADFRRHETPEKVTGCNCSEET